MPGRLQHRVDGQVVALVEVGERALPRQVGLVRGREVAVVIGGVVDGLAEGVVDAQAVVVAEALLQLEDPGVVHRIRRRAVHVALQQQRVPEAGDDGRSRAGRHPRRQRVGRRGVPVMQGDGPTVGQRPGGKGSGGQQVGIDRPGIAQPVHVDVGEAHRPAGRDLPLDAQGGLLRVGGAVVRLSGEEHGQRRHRVGVGDGDPERQQGAGRDAGHVARAPALDQPQGKERLKDRRRVHRRGQSRHARERHQHLRDLPEAVHPPQGLHHVGDLPVDGRVEDPEAAAHHRLVVLERIPGEAQPRGEVLVVGAQGAVLRVQLPAQPEVQGQVPRRRP